jgi:mono/diheme cytochrome c family protein
MKRIALAVVLSQLAFAGFTVARAEDAAELYGKKCASCHGKDGKGATPMGKKMGVKDLTDGAVQSKISDAEIEKQINEGVKGDDGKVKMPAFKEKLGPDDVKALVKQVRSFKG